MKCCICGPLRNCEPFLDKVLFNIEQIGTIFDDYEILIFYDESSDNSLTKLKKYQENNMRLKLYVNQTPVIEHID